MDEDRLRRELHGEVDGWEPTAGPLVARKGSPGLLGGIVAAVVLLAGGGAAVALTSSGGGHHEPVSLGVLAPSATATPTATPSPGLTCAGTVVSCDELAGSPVPSPSTSEPSPSVPVESPAAIPSPPVPSASGASPRPCTKDDIDPDLGIEGTSTVTQTVTVHIRARLHYLRSCVSVGGSGVTVTTPSGQFVEGRCGTAQQTHSCPAPDSGGYVVAAGHTENYDSVWDQVETVDAAGHRTWASSGDYRVVLEAEGSKTTVAVHVTAAPPCGDMQLSFGLGAPAPQSGYVQGDIVNVVGQAINQGPTCTATLVTKPILTVYDTAGAVVWSGCEPGGLAQGEPACSATPGPSQLVLAGAAVVLPDLGLAGGQPRVGTWSIVRDGDSDSGPSPAPAGNYSVLWRPFGPSGPSSSASFSVS